MQTSRTGATGVPAQRPGTPVPAAAAEIYASERTVVHRILGPDQRTVIEKNALGPAAVKRVRHERALLERLAVVPGVPRLVSSESDDVLLLEDLHGRPLAELIAASTPPDPWSIGGLAPDQVLQVAVDVASVLAGIHGAGVVHRDLNPANILVGVRDGDPLSVGIVDFDLATTFAQVRPGFIDAREIVGRLPYLAPEQTGRTGLSVDQRSDLYSLGATMYEMLTGRPPFSRDDPLAGVSNDHAPRWCVCPGGRPV
jgi:serine/threonine protein kinase